MAFLLLLPWLTEIPVLNAKSVNPDQTPHSVASESGLRCLRLSRCGTPGIHGLKPTRFLSGR